MIWKIQAPYFKLMKTTLMKKYIKIIIKFRMKIIIYQNKMKKKLMIYNLFLYQ